MNWGNKLLLVFAVFGGMISYMVYRCMQTPVNLVNKEYYKDELVYQQVIDGARKANALSGKVKLQQEAAAISLQFPVEMKSGEVRGTVLFYCPSDKAKDRQLPLILDAGARQEIGTSYFLPGHYNVKIRWENKGVAYFTEEPFTIQ
jgi:hypothetical protein